MKGKVDPISLVEGKVFIDGYECMDSVEFEITFTPRVWTGRQLGDRTDSSRWLGHSYKGKIKRRRSTDWLKVVIDKYIRTGETPSFTIQGISNDGGSDYFRRHGPEIRTAIGCVFTGDIKLLHLDANGEVLEDDLPFNAKDVV